MYIKCKYRSSGCRYKVPCMQRHEDVDCKYRPARCPSLTCPLRPPFATILDHIKVRGHAMFRKNVSLGITSFPVSKIEENMSLVPFMGIFLTYIIIHSKIQSVAFNEDSDVDFSQQDEHDGNKKGRDRVCRNNSSHLVSRYAQNQIAIKNHLLTLGTIHKGRLQNIANI